MALQFSAFAGDVREDPGRPSVWVFRSCSGLIFGRPVYLRACSITVSGLCDHLTDYEFSFRLQGVYKATTRITPAITDAPRLQRGGSFGTGDGLFN